MVDKDADEKIQRITKLLEKGGTMLATHHECGAPMFRYQGKVVCPVCDFPGQVQVIAEHRNIVENRSEKNVKKNNVPIQEEIRKITDMPYSRAPAHSAGMSDINDIIMKKTIELAQSLDSETELARIIDKMRCIEQGLTILKLLRE